jgi:hypothetical protein
VETIAVSETVIIEVTEENFPKETTGKDTPQKLAQKAQKIPLHRIKS